MRTIRHRLVTHGTDRHSRWADDTAEIMVDVTMPWEDGDEAENHGHPVLPQITLSVEGSDGEQVEEVSLSPIDTWSLYQALRESFDTAHERAGDLYPHLRDEAAAKA